MSEKRGDIQGLRGIAVLAVVVYHASHGVLPGGFAGVDIFFVISGYLITQILLKAMDGGGFSLREFYQRRVRRLFPALYVVLLVSLILGLLILPPKLLKEEVYSQFFTTLFLSNFAFARLADYFDTAAGLKPLLHTWSLGVEEQFYLVYPLVLLAIHRFARRYLWVILGVLAAVSLVVAEMSLRVRPEASFYLPTSRAFELLIGGLCLAVPTLSDIVKRVLSLAGLALIVVTLVFIHDGIAWPGVMTLLPVVGTACLLVSSGAWGNRVVAALPLVFTGDLSYSLYLWHWPLLVYGRMVFGDAATAPVLVLAFGLAWVSRRFIEVPFLRATRRVWLWAGVVMMVSIVSALLIFGADGLPQRFNEEQRAAFSASDDFNHDRNHCHLAKNDRIAYGQTCVYGDKAAPIIAVWGDSEGAELAPALGQDLAAKGMGVRQLTASACPPSLGYSIAYNPTCQAHNADMLAHLKVDPSVKIIYLTANYQRYADVDPHAMLSGMEASALKLKEAGKFVTIIYPLPIYHFDPPSQVGMAMRLGRDPRAVGMPKAQYLRENAAILAELDAFAKAHDIGSFKPSDVLCGANFCHVYEAEQGVLYFNGQHLSMSGARRIVQYMGLD